MFLPTTAVADPGIPSGSVNLLFGPIFAKKKLHENESRPKFVAVDSSLI